MKKFIFPIIAIFTLLSATGCSTKFKLDAPYKNITIVSGFLDEADTAHYIRIEKAFLDANQSAITLAKNPDSNYYPNLNVIVEQVDFLNTGNIINTFPLNKVDLNLEGYPKDTGVFFNAPNYAYKFKNFLDPNYSYRIVITNPATGAVDSAESPIIDDVDAGSITVNVLDNTSLNLDGLEFSVPNTYCEIAAAYNGPSNYNFYGQTSPVALAEAVIVFNWIDSNIANGTETAHSYTFNAGYYTPINNYIDYKINDLSLYSAIFAGMGDAPANIARIFLKCNLIIYLGTPDFESYQQSALSQGVGLTANEVEPIYTNVKGANAYGIYTSRGVRSGTIGFSAETMDSLKNGSILKNANIVGFSY